MKSSSETKHRKKRVLIPLLCCAALLLALLCAMGIYLETYYHASAEAVSVAESDAVSVRAGGQNVLIFEPEDVQRTGSADAAFIFYPGGKVQAEAYAPLCSALADRGILCAMVKMPFRLAVFDSGAASAVMDDLSARFGCTEFYLGGHSLGGAMAAGFAYQHADALRGLCLLGAYSAKDLSETGLRVLSVYGSEDGVLSREKYAQSAACMPDDFTELVIDGGCHAQFGDYGAQKGDGSPSISREEQISITADAIAQWISSGTGADAGD